MNTLHNGLVSVKVYSVIGNSFTEISLGEMNHLGRFQPGAILLLRFMVNQSDFVDHVVPVTTNREKTMAMMLPSVLRFGVRAFEHEVRVLPGDKPGRVKVDNNKNLVRFLAMANKGLVVSKNIAVIVQKGEFYLAPSETYRVQAYRTAEGKVAVPDLYSNDDGKGSFTCIKSFVDGHYGPQYALPLESTYKKPCLPDASSLPDDNSLVVLSWSLSNGVGVGLRKDGTKIKLHWSKVNVADRVPVYLFEGEIVQAKSFSPVPNAQPGSLDIQADDMTRTEDMIEMPA